MPPFSNRLSRVSLLALALCLSIHLSEAGSATWKQSPIDNDWFNAANWTPATVPDETTDVATFGISTTTNISAASVVPIAGIVFEPNAAAYNMTVAISLWGDGITNNSGVIQNFDISPGVSFRGTTTAGTDVIFTNNGATSNSLNFFSFFEGEANAGSATFINNGAPPGAYSGLLYFLDESTAAEATIINNGPAGEGEGGVTDFDDSSSAGNSTVVCYAGASVSFRNTSTAANATLIADGGVISFKNKSSGGFARSEIMHGGVLNLGPGVPAGRTLGSVEGDGTLQLVAPLFVGGNGLNTTFSGTITGTAITKIGNEILTLSGSNKYTGGTTVAAGTLLVSNTNGSATGTGAVRVNGGTFGGRSNITGAVTIGSGSGTGAFLAPGINGPGTLVIRNTLTFKSDGTYNCDLSLSKSKADQIVCKGVTIESGAQFAFNAKGNQTLANGTVFTVLENKTRQHISGTFSNLPDHSTFSANGNTFQVSYEGGDGNDLTLTVVP